MEIGSCSNYNDSNRYPVYLDTNGVITTNGDAYYYGISLHSTELYTDINRQSKIFLIILFLFKLTLLRTGLRNLPTISNCPKIWAI